MSVPSDFEAEIQASAAAMGHAETPAIVAGVLATGMQRSLQDEWNMDALTAKGRQIARAPKS